MTEAVRCGVFVAPHIGGIFTFSRRFAEALAAIGIDGVSIEAGDERANWRDHDASLASPNHRRIDLKGATGVEASRRIADWLVAEQINLVIVTPMTPNAVIDALPHLPPQFRVLTRLTEISQHSYTLALRHADALDGVITLCPRQEDDIAARASALPRFRLPNGVDTDRFLPASTGPSDGPLRLLVLDRLVHLQKRILLLPKLCAALDRMGVAFELAVVGDGPDKAALEAGLAPWVARAATSFHGRVAPDEAPALMAQHDVYLKLSRNEGSPNALLEAMAAGLCPVAAHIPGVTDFVLTDGQEGLLTPPDDITAMARAIATLDTDRGRLTRLSTAARARVEAEFNTRQFTARVADIIPNLPETSARTPRPWSEWRSSEPSPGPFRKLAKRLIPLSLRMALRDRLGRA